MAADAGYEGAPSIGVRCSTDFRDLRRERQGRQTPSSSLQARGDMRDVDLGGTAVTLAPRADIAIKRTPSPTARPSGRIQPQHRQRRIVGVVCIVAERLGVSAIAGALTHPAVPHL